MDVVSARYSVSEGIWMQDPAAGLSGKAVMLLEVRFLRTFVNRLQDRNAFALDPSARSSGVASVLFRIRVG